MKRYNSMRRENSAGAQRKALAWMISIMLVVTGILPSFASNNKVTGAGDTKSTPSASKTVRAPKMCTVRFSALGADNVPAAVKVPKGEKLGSNYPKEIPTKNGYKFIGWTDGVFSMNEPNVDENYVINENKTFYAVWRTIIRVTFDAGGGTGNMETAEIAKGSDYELPECGFTPPSGKEFHKWSVSFGGKAPVEKAAREKIVVNADTVVKALWKDTESGFNLNASGNVKAKLENNKDLNIAAKDPTKDVKIDREKWNDMVKALGGKIDNSGDPSWGQSLVTGNIKVDSEVYLPQNSRHMFHAFKGNLLGADKFNTSEVTDMSGIFNYAKSVDADVSKWNVSNVTKMTGMFDGATSAKPDVSKWNTSKVTDMVSMFFGAKSANPDVSKWDVSNVTNVINMFYGATSAKPDVSKWGTSKITKMNWMFYGATSANPDVSKWDTSKVTDMAKMFYGATSAKPDTSKWDVSNVTDMSGMFYGATSANPDVSKWDTSKVTNMWGVFYGAKSATPDVSKWDTSKVTNMNSLFEGASAANPDASKWNTSNVTDMSFVFKNSGIKRIDFTKWNIDKVEESDKMFDGCANLEFVKTPSGLKTDISGAKDDFRIVKFKKDSAASVEKDSQNLNDKYEINKDGDKDAIYHIYKKNKYVGVTFDKNGGDKEAWMNHEITEKGKSIKDSNGNMPAENPTKKDNKFLGWSKDKTASASDFNEDTAVNEDITVYALWKKPQISDFDLNASGNVKAKLENNKNINIAVLDTSKDMKIDRTKWQDMVKALGGTINGNDIDWENAAVKDMHFKTDGIKLPSDSSKLFSNFKEVIRGSEKLNTDDVVNMASMFSGAKQATPDVLHWNTSGVTNMKNMFNGAKCAIPDVDDWDVSKVTDMQYMFKNTSISRVRLSKWKLNSEILNNADKSIGMFTGCDELEYLKTSAGLRTTIGGTNKNFKIVKLKKGSPVEIEKESHNLKDEYEINKDGDSAAVYHIYEKSKYVGVIFDKNHADTEAWVNHAITFKGWSLGSGIGKLPAENPALANGVFMGWAKTVDASMPDFELFTKVKNDMKVYATWRKTEFDLNASGNVKARLDGDKNLNITASDTSADMKIDRTKWKEALKILGGKIDGFDGNRLSWRKADIKDINFQTQGIYLPQDCSSFFREVQTSVNGCENLNTSNVTDMNNMFYGAKKANPNTSNWDTSKVSNMKALFQFTDKANPNVTSWNTSKVTNARDMFRYAIAAMPAVSNWDTSEVTDMGGMFDNAKSANPDVSKWNVSKVTNMGGMFEGATSANPNVSEWNVSNAIFMIEMFRGASSASPDVSKWNVSKVTHMRQMFEGATSANPDVSKWNVSKVKDIDRMFKESAVKKLNLSSWKLNQDLLNDNGKMQDIFKGCANIEYLKTPKGLKTDISGANADFKIVRLKKDSAPSIEQENQNLNDNYEINKDGDSSAIYHIYDKNKYAGVIFDKNGGDKEAWMNHEITEKGKSIKESNGALPTENPNKNDHKFLGWSTDKDAGKPNFDEETVVNSDVIAYAVLHKDTAFDLNASGNVKAKIDNDGNMTISAENPTGDINIDSAKWAEMVNALGGQNFAWSESFKGNMIIDSNVYLPQDCSYMFYNFKGKLIGADKFNTSRVTLMTAMFYLASSVNPDVLTWDTSNVTDMTIMFKNAAAANPDVSNWNTSKLSGAEQMFVYSAIKKADLSKWDVSALNNSDSMFFGCEGLEYLKTPKGFKTSVEKINKDFKVVKLKKGSEATVEHESKNLNSEFTINAEGDKEAAYNIYSKDTYVGVLFDKNDADTSAFRNHEITEKGKSLKDSKIGLPEVNPGRAGHKFLGWSKSKTATAPDFDESTVVDSDITAYAVWKKDTPPAPTKVTVTLDGNGGVLAGGASATIAVDKGSTVKEQLEAAVANNIFTKAGYRLIGFSKSKFAATADYDLDSPVYSDTTLYAVYEETHEVTTVTIKYTEVGMQDDEVIENVPLGKAIGDKLGGHERALDGHSFLGYSKVKGATKPDFFKNSIVTDNLVLYPVYKEIGSAEKVKVAFKLNDGTDGSLKTVEVNRYESLGDKMPTRDKVPAREGYIFIGWAKSKTSRYPDFFRGTAVKGDMTVYAVWKSLYAEKLGQPELKVLAKAKGYELTIVPPKENLHTGFEIFRSEKKDFKPGKDNKIAIIDRNTLKYLDDKADNSKAYYYAVRAIDEDGSYNGTKVTFIGKLSDSVLAVPLPKERGVTATVAGKGAVDLEFNKTIAAAKYKVTVTAPYDKKFKEQVKEIEAGKLVAVSGNKVKANVKGLPMGKFLAFKLEALEADNDKLVEYGNSFAFMLGAVEKLTAKMNKKSRVLHIKFNAMKGVSGYEAKIVIGGKVKTIKLKKGNKKLRDFIVGSFKLPKKKGNYTFTIRAFKKIGKLKYYGQTITKTFR